MEITLTGNKAKNIVYYATNTRKIRLYKDSKQISEMFIQGPNILTTNLFSLINRLEVDEIDKIQYNPSVDEEITIFKKQGEITTLYQTRNEKRWIG